MRILVADDHPTSQRPGPCKFPAGAEYGGPGRSRGRSPRGMHSAPLRAGSPQACPGSPSMKRRRLATAIILATPLGRGFRAPADPRLLRLGRWLLAVALAVAAPPEAEAQTEIQIHSIEVIQQAPGNVHEDYRRGWTLNARVRGVNPRGSAGGLLYLSVKGDRSIRRSSVVPVTRFAWMPATRTFSFQTTGGLQIWTAAMESPPVSSFPSSALPTTMRNSRSPTRFRSARFATTRRPSRMRRLRSGVVRTQGDQGSPAPQWCRSVPGHAHHRL